MYIQNIGKVTSDKTRDSKVKKGREHINEKTRVKFSSGKERYKDTAYWSVIFKACLYLVSFPPLHKIDSTLMYVCTLLFNLKGSGTPQDRNILTSQ